MLLLLLQEQNIINIAAKTNSKIYSANYVVCAHKELTMYFDTLPFDNSYKLDNNLNKIEDMYHTLSNLVLEDLEKALKRAEESNSKLNILELRDIFRDLTIKNILCHHCNVTASY